MKKTVYASVTLLFLLLIYFVSFRQALLFLVGIGYGVVLAGVGFGFTTGWRRFIEVRDSGGIAAQFFLILILFLLSAPFILLFPQISPADASISFSLLLGSFVFGLFMQLADGCGSGTLYKAGGLKTLNLWVFLGFVIGAFWGSVDIPYWLSWGSVLPAYNFLRDGIELGGNNVGWIVEGVVLIVIWGLFHRWSKGDPNPQNHTSYSRLPYNKLLKGAGALALLAWLNLLIAGQPWGIVYGLGLWGAKAFQVTGMGVSDTLYWGGGYNLQSLQNSLLLDAVSITNLGLLSGAFIVSLRTRAKDTPTPSEGKETPIKDGKDGVKGWVLKPLAVVMIGVVLGYSSRMAFGCNIGAFVSGISTGSLHGWVWAAMAFTGSTVGVRARRSSLIKYLHS